MLQFPLFQVRSTDYTWKEAKKSLKKDSRWESAGALDREEKEKLFNNHVENLTKRKREKFRYTLFSDFFFSFSVVIFVASSNRTLWKIGR